MKDITHSAKAMNKAFSMGLPVSGLHDSVEDGEAEIKCQENTGRGNSRYKAALMFLIR